jgi:subtilase family serine protease
VPANLGGAVTGVLGLSSLGASLAPTPSVPNLNGFYPKQLATAYDAGSTAPGTNTTLAVIAEGNLAPTITDLRTAEAQQGLPQVPVNQVNVGPASADTSGVDEWDLDTQSSTGVAPGAQSLTLYIATSLSNSDLSRAINRFASDGTAKSASASLGECDILPFLDGSMAVDDAALAQAAAQGQTFFASTGDTGSSCAVAPTNGVPLSGLPDTEYPASSPYAVAVGGTTLFASSAGDGARLPRRGAGRKRDVRRDARLGLHDRTRKLGRRRAERRAQLSGPEPPVLLRMRVGVVTPA